MEADVNSFLVARDVDSVELERRAVAGSERYSTVDGERTFAYRPDQPGAERPVAFDTERIVESYHRPVGMPAFTGSHFRFAGWLFGPLRLLARSLFRLSVALDRRVNEHRARAFRALAEETGRLHREVAELRAEVARLRERQDTRDPS